MSTAKPLNDIGDGVTLPDSCYNGFNGHPFVVKIRCM